MSRSSLICTPRVAVIICCSTKYYITLTSDPEILVFIKDQLIDQWGRFAGQCGLDADIYQ